MKQLEPTHFAYIDAVRGLAFLGVLLCHVAALSGHFFGRPIMTSGAFGVQLFYLASAITLCHSMVVRQKVDAFPNSFFYLRRLFRIAPLFWTAMVVYWIVPGILPRSWFPEDVHPSYFVLTALFLHGWHPLTFNAIVPGGWSIAVEMTFYIFFPLLFWMLATSLRRTILAVLVSTLLVELMAQYSMWPIHGFSAGISDRDWNFFTNYWFPTQLPVFLTGFLVYHLLRNGSIKALVKRSFLAHSLLCLCGVLLIVLLRGSSVGGYAAFSSTAYITEYLPIVLIMAGIILIMSGGSLTWLVNPVICYIGRISYSCYLVHFAAMAMTLRWFHNHLETGNTFSNFLIFAVFLTSTLSLTVMIATITLHLIENPGIALGRRTIQWMAGALTRP